MLWKIKMLLKTICMKISYMFPNLMSDEAYSRLLYFIVFGKKINLDNPKTFNENVVVRKLENTKFDYDKYTDKYEVRSYVAKTIDEDILNEIYGIYDTFDEIDFDTLPESFALKATHASGYNIIVKEKAMLDREQARRQFNKWLKINFYYKDREKNYKNIKPRILCEKYVSFSEHLIEYKLYCFNGRVGFVCQNINIDKKRYTNVLDEEFNPLPVRFGYDTFENYPISDKKGELKLIAEKLAKPFEFVRVDLYENNGEILFSELTFHSGGGLVPFAPEKYDVYFGSFFERSKSIKKTGEIFL